MEFMNFTTLVREEVERRTGDNYRVRLNDVRKNNGVVLRGLTVMQDDSNISPTIYLNNYYEEYANGRATLVNVYISQEQGQPERGYAVFSEL